MFIAATSVALRRYAYIISPLSGYSLTGKFYSPRQEIPLSTIDLSSYKIDIVNDKIVTAPSQYGQLLLRKFQKLKQQLVKTRPFRAVSEKTVEYLPYKDWNGN